MNKKMFTNLCYVMTIVLMIIGQFGSKAIAETITPTVAGDDPGITITATNPITSKQLVQVDVSIASTAGTITEVGVVKVTIPKVIVNSQSDLVNRLVIGDPFYLDDPAVTYDENGDYVLNLAYDHTKYDPNDAQGNTVKIIFDAPYMDSTSSDFPDSVDFSADMYMGSELISSDKTTSEVKVTVPGNPLLQKYGVRSYGTVDGKYSSIIEKDDPSRNIFVIVVNYNQQSIQNAKIVDTIPEGTELYDPYRHIPATGDDSIVNHFRIAKVTERRSDGIATGWEYVTTDFSDKIHITDTGFTIDFGDLTPDDSYVIMYAQKITGDPTAEEFGARYNKVVLTSDDAAVMEQGTYMALQEVKYDSVNLNKEVSQATLASNSGDLIYTLTFKNNIGDTKIGTTLTDPLPDHITFIETTENTSGYLSDVNYDAETNSISYDLLKELPEGEQISVSFKVHYENPEAQPGETIVNKAYFNYAGTNIGSKDATTTLDGSAYLYKTDEETQNPLSGAEFKVIDSEGATVTEGLVSDENGFINSGLLQPGEYEFIEVKAPNGYQLDSTPIKFTVVAGQDTPINLTMTNKEKEAVKGSVQLTKVDSKSKKVLSGAEFTLVSSDGERIQEGLTTDEQGNIVVSNLDSGDYQFIETKAPNGYQLDATPVQFTINEDDDTIVLVTKENTPNPEETESNTTTDDSTTESSKEIVKETTEETTSEISSETENTNQENETIVSKRKKVLPKTGEQLSSVLVVGAGVSFVGIAVYLFKKNR